MQAAGAIEMVAIPGASDQQGQRHDGACQRTQVPGHRCGRRWRQSPAIRLPLFFERVFSDHAVFIETEKASGRADESPVKCTARQLIPLPALKSFEEASADARRRRNLLKRDASHLPLSFEMFAERCQGGPHGSRANGKYRRRFPECQSCRAGPGGAGRAVGLPAIGLQCPLQ